MRHTRRRDPLMNRSRPASFTILVIDDDPELLELATELLSGDGHRVLVASSGEDALAMMQAVHPDLILLDYFMPEMNGLAVIERLKADAATRRIPVVALTSGTAGDASRLSRAGSVGFILKPFEPTEFLRLIADILKATVGSRQRRSDGVG
jgi:CheY-like chemotaxis protein